MFELIRVHSNANFLEWVLEQESELFGDGALNRWSLLPIAHTQFLFLGCEKGVPVGYAIFFEDLQNPGFLYLFSFGISRPFQGRGMGWKLATELRDWSLENDYEGWTLTLSPQNQAASGLYKKLGPGVEELHLPDHYGKGEDRLWWKIRFIASDD